MYDLYWWLCVEELSLLKGSELLQCFKRHSQTSSFGLEVPRFAAVPPVIASRQRFVTHSNRHFDQGRHMDTDWSHSPGQMTKRLRRPCRIAEVKVRYDCLSSVRTVGVVEKCVVGKGICVDDDGC